MADISPEEARHNRKKDAKATDENSGYSIEGDTPPAEGLGVGPDNPELDVDRRGERAKGKVWLVLILALVVVVLLLFIGRFIGTF